MSLLKETASNVIDVEYLVADNVYANFTNFKALQGYEVISGYLSPRGLGYYLARDNKTDEPIKLPPNSMPLQAYFIPSIPLDGGDVAGYNIQLTLFEDEAFTNPSTNPWTSDGQWSGEDINGKAFTEMTDCYSYFTDFANLPYVGIEVSNNPYTDGTFQLYIFYQPGI